MVEGDEEAVVNVEEVWMVVFTQPISVRFAIRAMATLLGFGSTYLCCQHAEQT